ncbi:hypothetical protein D3C87_1487150 [compost metagenome]
MKKTVMMGSRLFTENTQRSGRSGLSAERSIFSRLGARDSGRMKNASSRLLPFRTAAAMKGSRSQVSPKTPPSTGPMMKPMPNMALNRPKRRARLSSGEMSVM